MLCSLPPSDSSLFFVLSNFVCTCWNIILQFLIFLLVRVLKFVVDRSVRVFFLFTLVRIPNRGDKEKSVPNPYDYSMWIYLSLRVVSSCGALYTKRYPHSKPLHEKKRSTATKKKKKKKKNMKSPCRYSSSLQLNLQGLLGKHLSVHSLDLLPSWCAVFAFASFLCHFCEREHTIVLPSSRFLASQVS